MKKIILSLVCAIALFIIFVIFFITRNYKRFDQLTIVSAPKIISIPFQITQGGHILIDVEVDNSGEKYPFLVDTGASNYLFQNFPAEKIGKSIGRGLSQDTNGIFNFPRIYTLNYLKFGTIIFEDITFNTVVTEFNCMDEVYGIIGKNIMHHFVWQFDYKNKIIHIAKERSLLPQENGEIVSIPLIENEWSHHLYVPVKINDNTKTNVILDTGMSRGFQLTQNIVDQLEHVERVNILGEGSRGLGGKSDSKQYYVDLKNIVLGNKDGFAIDSISVDVSEKSSFKAIGMDFLKNFKFTVDWNEDLLTLNQQVDTLNLYQKGFGTVFGFENDEVYIKAVIENSKAHQLGLKAGMKNFEINGNAFKTEKQFCDYRLIMRDLDTIQLNFLNPVKEYTIFKENL